MFGALIFLGLATFASAHFRFETYLQKGLKDQPLPPATSYIIPSRTCTWDLDLSEEACFKPFTLAVKVTDKGSPKASPKLTFNEDLTAVHVEREGILCLGEAEVEVQALCYAGRRMGSSGRRQSSRRQQSRRQQSRRQQKSRRISNQVQHLYKQGRRYGGH